MRVALERRNCDETWPVDGIDPQLVDPERDPELAAALRRLPPRRRLIVFLRYFGDFRMPRSPRPAGSAKELSRLRLLKLARSCGTRSFRKEQRNDR